MFPDMLPSDPSPIDVQAMMRGLVHELRNPLSAILTAASLLQSGEGDTEESAMLLDVVQKESRRMNRILTEFSSFVKPPATQPEIFDIGTVIRDLMREMKKEGALGAGIEVRDELPAQVTVFADPMQSYQAFQHLLCNAAQAMENGGTLTLHTSSADSHTIIVLEDDGPGFTSAALERAFQPFFSTKPAATGLGLSIAHGLLSASGGALFLENRDAAPDAPRDLSPDKLRETPESMVQGARVRVHLPRTANSEDSSS